MEQSESIHELATALAKAQGALEGAAKSKANPFFKSKYADLASVWEACREALSANGLAVVQSASAQGAHVTVTTLLLHSSGQWVRDGLTMTAKADDPQGVGSAITYARRYALAAFVGVAPEDDDAESAMGRKPGHAPEAPIPAGFADWMMDFEATADLGIAAMTAAWKAAPPQHRDYAASQHGATLTAIKAKALKVQA
jgi:hypothetical protein